ncbi:MAG: transposase [Verrucomicrobiae bacterium]|nr:transposase [Verrucomicrobiae bacterium]
MSLKSTAFTIQRYLFPMLEEEIGPLSDHEQRFVRIVELTHPERFMSPYAWLHIGRKPACVAVATSARRRPEDRLPMAKAYIAKAVWNFPNARALLDYLRNSPTLRRLCGWPSALRLRLEEEIVAQIPSEPTFSRAFAEFAKFRLPEEIHAALVKENLGDTLVGHISRDATAIPAREKPAAKPTPAPKPETPKKRGRPAKGQPVQPKEPRRLELQPSRSLEENLADLPILCDHGTKRSSQGYKDSWIGYKLHLDVIDGDIPISAILTSASVHDSQVSIPLAQLSFQRVNSFYDLADSAYDAKEIHAFSRQLGHVPIIDPNPRRGDAIPLDPASLQRFKQRTSVERVNSQLKDNFGAKTLRVRGAAKVMCHLMFGVLACTAIQLFQRLVT